MAWKYYQKLILIFNLSFALFALESFIKYYLILNKVPMQGFYLFLKIIQIIFIPNQNIAFNLPLPQFLIIVIVIVILILLALIWWQSLIIGNLTQILALSLIMLGALSNLVDRLLFGYVIDYINLFIWPVFNLADVMIVAGVIIYILSEFKKPKVKTLTI